MAIRQVNLGRVIQIGFIVILTLILANGVAIFWTMHKLTNNLSWVAHSYDVKSKLESLMSELTDIETGQRGFLYTGKEDFLEPYTNSLRTIPETQKITLELVKNNPAQVQRLKVISDLTQQRLDGVAQTIVFQKSGKKKEARDYVLAEKGKKIMDSLRVQVDEMTREENSLLEQRVREATTSENLSTMFVSVGTFIAFATGLYIFLFISRNVIVKFMLPVNEAIAAISSSTNEILVTMEEHERTASQQSAAANETSATITELSASSRQSADQAANAAAVAEKASEATVQGGEVTRQAVAAMGDLKDKIAALSDQILRLGEQTGQIGSIAILVKDLSAQINMLSLNAAVEAARAGENGKGFAVVASEVRKLADQSKKSAEQATVLVADIQKSTHSSIMMTEEGARTVSEVMQLTQKVAELFNNLSGMAGSVSENAQQVMHNAKQQSAAFTQVVEATNSIASGARETAAGISQTKLGVQKLNEAAVSLKAIA
jgi:methyl-accepting chemotaxis protein